MRFWSAAISANITSRTPPALSFAGGWEETQTHVPRTKKRSALRARNLNGDFWNAALLNCLIEDIPTQEIDGHSLSLGQATIDDFTKLFCAFVSFSWSVG
jgi:hypothetical protein